MSNMIKHHIKSEEHSSAIKASLNNMLRPNFNTNNQTTSHPTDR